MEHFTAAFRNFANFKDRATRSQYWIFALIYILSYFILAMIESMIGLPVLTGIYALIMLIPSLAYGARRLHDIGRSGWWQLLMLIPLIGAIVLIVMWSLPSKEEAQGRFALQAA